MVWDVNQIKQITDCRDVVERSLGAPKHKTGHYNVYRCPLHRETKGYSLAVYADHWICYGKCNTSGDAIKWMQSYHGLSFQQACTELGGHLTSTIARGPAPRPAAPSEPVSEPPSAEWQNFGRELVTMAEERLWSAEGKRALAYLKTTRGLSTSVIRMANLGYIPPTTESDYKYGRVFFPQWTIEGKPVRAHCGITIPHFADDALWAIRVRRPPGIEGSKYMGIRGGSKVLYRIDEVLERAPVVITEGEFDALVLDYCAGYRGSCVRAIALCSASNKHIHSRWLDKLVCAPVILARLDDDGAGTRATEVLKALSSRVRSIQVPAPHKDVNEFYLAEGVEAVRAWIEGELVCQS